MRDQNGDGAITPHIEVPESHSAALRSDHPAGRTVSGDEGIAIALRELVSCVTVTPTADRESPRISVTGRLSVLVGGDLFPHSRGDIGGSGGALQLIRPTENIMFFRRSA